MTFVSYVDPTPAVRFQTMAAALAAVDRPIVYGICQWGVGNDLVAWASQTGNSWRMSNDIFDAWSSIWRITNQVVPLAPFSKPGNFNDMDMLIVSAPACGVGQGLTAGARRWAALGSRSRSSARTWASGPWRRARC